MDIKDILLKKKLLTETQYQEVENASQQLHSSIEEVLIGKNYLTKQQLGEAVAEKFHVPYADLANMQLDQEIIKLIPKDIALEHKIIALGKTTADLKVGMVNPLDLKSIEFVRKGTGYNIVPYYITEGDFHESLRYYKTEIKQEFKDIIEQHVEETKKSGKTDETALPIIKIVDTILEYALSGGASDVHIESLENGALVRYRIDGILHDIVTLPKVVLLPIIARVKILSNLKIDEHRLPQDGRFKTTINDQSISFRVSIIPTYYGEKIVMRILEDSAKNYSLEDLGFSQKDLRIVTNNIHKPNGMILVTGPTGSGKSTTLYTVLGILNTPQVNICTVEDPIEYSMPRVNQVQINPQIGLTFAAGLRAFLRQDPNIILVGEIRDTETADIAINASMTGHLVLSTLHTNSSAGAIPRLIDMHIEPFLIASTINIIIAQRLVRKLCAQCKEEYDPSSDSRNTLIQGLEKSKVLTPALQETIETSKFYRAPGCTHCSGGYKGRIGIYEVLEVTDAIKGLIMENANSSVIEAKALEEGTSLMVEDGIEKAKQGTTSIEEILRVTKE